VNAWEGLSFLHKGIDDEKICISTYKTLQKDLILSISEARVVLLCNAIIGSPEVLVLTESDLSPVEHFF